MNGRRFVITGAGGFVGRATVALMDDGKNIVETLSRSNVDYFDPAAIKKALEPRGIPTTVIHLAGTAHRRVDDPEKCFAESIVQLTSVLLNSAIEVGVDTFVYASSSKVYGESSGLSRITERTIPQPGCPYGRAKLVAENLILSKSDKIKCRILRFPPIFGPSAGGAVKHLMRAAKLGVPLPLFDSALPLRNFLYIENAAKFIEKAATAKDFPEILNPVDGPSLTVAEFYDRLRSAITANSNHFGSHWELPKLIRNGLKRVPFLEPLFAPFEIESEWDANRLGIHLFDRDTALRASVSV